MSIINTMRKFIANQAQTMFIIRDAKYADPDSYIPLYGYAEDGAFDKNGKFDGQGDYMT